MPNKPNQFIEELERFLLDICNENKNCTDCPLEHEAECGMDYMIERAKKKKDD